jgi:dTDP-4-dehydrorhamnose 3,5-epimerase/CDP-3, 6-dideoxy-D-glycero-D-glycero-4-hexulose-5-epimerase
MKESAQIDAGRASPSVLKAVREILPGCFLLQPARVEDHRGAFVKTFHEELFRELGLRFETREEFYSISRKNVLRGMHFQAPPHDHEKLVYCLRGRVLDVVLDLREGPGFGRAACVELSGENRMEAFIPRGVAHGFLALSDEAQLLYKTSSVHAPAFDMGVRWDGFGFDWGVRDPIVSPRDNAHPTLAAFNTPFTSREAAA